MNMSAFDAIVIGSSLGALDALSDILRKLDAPYPLPIMVVVHVPANKKSEMPDLLKAKCKIVVKEAEDKEPIFSNMVYFAPPDYHLQVEQTKRLSLSNEEPLFYSRPSIDILFETAAEAYGSRLLGIILTGANEDGAKGLKAVMNEGGTGIVQSPKNAYASAMPEAALKACPGAMSLTLEQITDYLKDVSTHD